jgi:citrate lyase subunit beta/citryl-CoA lyase
MNFDLGTARSLLFVPGNRPERFTKAAASGADAIIIDLEDAVAPIDKHAALDNTREWLARGNSAVVRINGFDTAWHDEELNQLESTGAVLMLPKAEPGSQLSDLARRLGSMRVFALVETASGIQDCDAVCSTEGVVRVALGTVDLATELGIDPDADEALSYARSRLRIASAAARIASPVDGVTTALGSPETLERALAVTRKFGFEGKLCIHPNQVSVVNRGLAPTAADLLWAERVLAADMSEGVVVVDGAMVDAPVIARAERIAACGRQE